MDPGNREIVCLAKMVKFRSFNIPKDICLAFGFGAVASWNGLKENN